MKIGRKLGTKLLNASKFVLGFGEPPAGASPTTAIDRAMLARLAEVVDESTRALEEFDYARALERTESFFWWFCDDYVELVKGRAYGTQGDDAAHSARAALREALDIVLRLFAPFVPFVTEEVWSWWREGSVHSSSWPETSAAGRRPVTAESRQRRAGSHPAQQDRSQTQPTRRRRGTPRCRAAYSPRCRRSCRSDLAEAGGIVLFTLSEAANLQTTVRLAPSTDVQPAH